MVMHLKNEYCWVFEDYGKGNSYECGIPLNRECPKISDKFDLNSDCWKR